jgi:hypothetical protein
VDPESNTLREQHTHPLAVGLLIELKIWVRKTDREGEEGEKGLKNSGY